MDEPDDFKNFALPFPAQFHMLEELVRPNIQQCNTNYRDCVSVGEHLMAILRFLATGRLSSFLGFLFQLGVSTIRQIIPKTCNAIYQVLREKYLKVCAIYLKGAIQVQVHLPFMSQWNFPNCLGAVDGKHINILFHGCTLADALVNRTTNIPAPPPLPSSDQLSPYCIVADEAFPLTVEQVVENAFGIMANRFCVLLTTINIRDTVTVEYIVLACCALHNFPRSEGSDAYMADIVDQEGPDREIIEGRWRQDPALQQAPLPQTTNAAARAKQIRDELCRYFMSDTGAVPFQWDKI
uniref:DDE Tnp4 domain-containing protein n=1 Tax=Dicentrarchus labrax TaxID=13489 RepID=A0A8P4KIM3_DICLA